MLEIKPYTIGNEQAASLQDWTRCYGDLMRRDPRWLIGLPAIEKARRLDAELDRRYRKLVAHRPLAPLQSATPSWLTTRPLAFDAKRHVRELASLMLAKEAA